MSVVFSFDVNVWNGQNVTAVLEENSSVDPEGSVNLPTPIGYIS